MRTGFFFRLACSGLVRKNRPSYSRWSGFFGPGQKQSGGRNISLYRSRDLLERSFDMLKNDLALLLLNVKRRESLCGLLFVSFLSLLFRIQLQQQLQTTGLVKKYSLENVFLSLANIRWVILPGEKDRITDIGKNQRLILDASPILPEVQNFVTT